MIGLSDSGRELPAPLPDYSNELAKSRDLRNRVAEIKRSKDFNDVGALKRAMLDMWIEERQARAKRVVLYVEAQRREAAE